MGKKTKSKVRIRCFFKKIYAVEKDIFPKKCRLPPLQELFRSVHNCYQYNFLCTSESLLQPLDYERVKFWVSKVVQEQDTFKENQPKVY